ncbi:hypothetical protein [Rodentibacter haemolyticus]|uniref:Uncharacterized protein n=1 Tax=Rodentibacter haemolyticus TaxID=2778911 RepID=A0ABX6UW14_9PAST|nr:hypothetical protein [Rodentibacter haemolyticus]QPB42189.1 hypothetical protein IHV77_09770 [Rodentibacter haemolyticus]
MSRYYRIEPHPKDLGYQAVEYIGRKVTWKSQNHCAEELCETEIALRKTLLRKVEEGKGKVKTKGAHWS